MCCKWIIIESYDAFCQNEKMCHVRIFLVRAVCVLVLLCLPYDVVYSKNCDLTLRSSQNIPKNGTFTSPNWPKHYNNSLRCIYRFIGLPSERVQIKFVKFAVNGGPKCSHDYVDVYTQVKSPDDDLLDIPLHGRYCGEDLDQLPHLLISLHSIFIVGFYTDSQKAAQGFQAEYSFIDSSQYVIGTPAPPDVCGQIIKSETMPRGTLLSPTYPGMYPDNIFCYYKLQGQAGQRIKFTFVDLNLYSGGEHCPFDYVKIYDGYTNQAETIGVYCGNFKNIEIFSTTESMHIEFVTKSGRVEPTKKPYMPYWEREEDLPIQQRGFKATFEISSNFVSLDFIKEGYHVRGTECDQRVLSKGESNGTIISPGFPGFYPINVTCRYYVDGLVDKQNLEKAILRFKSFHIPTIKQSCDNGFVKAYLRGQDITAGADREFCGDVPPPKLTTSNPRLLLVLDTHGSYSGRGFKAFYQFLTDYAIPGTPAANDKCHFLYRSASHKHGHFNSPRHPSNYPHDTTCIYEFIGQTREQVRITFENFKVDDRYKNCSTDYVEVYGIGEDENSDLGPQQKMIGRYCGEYVPGPIVSEETVNRMKITFKTDSTVFESGFRAKYEFIERKPYATRCLWNYTRGGGGIIRSPNYPHKYLINTTCEWHVYAQEPNAKILLQFVSFAMEGNPTVIGCANAVLKIYPNNSGIPAYEMCGGEPFTWQIVSDANFVKLKFISSARAVGGKGFQITWTEIMPEQGTSSLVSVKGPQCKGFKCKTNGFCIAESLKCNNLPNCGEGDKSDETEKCPSYSNHGVLHIVLGVVIALVLLVFILVCVIHRRRKAKHRKHKQEIEVRYVTRGAAAAPPTANCSNSILDNGPKAGDKLLLKERTEKVSIV